MAIFNNPFPLLDNEKGNFSDWTFDCELKDSKIENGKYYFHFKATLDEEVIENLIEEEFVSFVIKVESRPYFYKFFKSGSDSLYEVKFELDYKDVSSNFSFNFTPLLITNQAFAYKNENADSPLNEYTFNLTSNQIIGSCPALKLTFQKAYRTIDSGPLIKVVRYKAPKKPEAGTMDIKLNDMDQIIVYLSDSTYDKFIEVNKRDPKLLDSLVALPVLQFALSEVLNDNSGVRELEWAKLLDREFEIFEMDNQEDVLNKCDEILNGSIPSFLDHFIKKYDNN
jgi:hypothetical protein